MQFAEENAAFDAGVVFSCDVLKVQTTGTKTLPLINHECCRTKVSVILRNWDKPTSASYRVRNASPLTACLHNAEFDVGVLVYADDPVKSSSHTQEKK